MNENQQHNGFQAMPILFHQPQPLLHDRLRAEVPPRVEKAFELLRALTLKGSISMAGRMERSGTQDMGTLIVEGQKLTIEEEMTQRQALELLSSYFNGKLKESGWDGVREAQVEEFDPDNWNEIPCPNCTMLNPHTRGNCLMCGNKGKVKVARVG